MLLFELEIWVPEWSTIVDLRGAKVSSVLLPQIQLHGPITSGELEAHVKVLIKSMRWLGLMDPLRVQISNSGDWVQFQKCQMEAKNLKRNTIEVNIKLRRVHVDGLSRVC